MDYLGPSKNDHKKIAAARETVRPDDGPGPGVGAGPSGETGVYSLLAVDGLLFIAVRYLSGGLGALCVLILMVLNFVAVFAAKERRAWIASALIAYSHLMIFSYTLSNFYYFDVFNGVCLTASLALVSYAYLINGAFLAFLFLSFAQIAAINAYFDYFNVNALFSGIAQMSEIILMPLIFLPFVIMSFYHKLRSESGFCVAHLTVLISGLSFYLFIVKLEPAPGAMALVAAGFVLAFTAFILPAKSPDAPEVDEDSNGCRVLPVAAGVGEIDARVSAGAMAVNIVFIIVCAALYAFAEYRMAAPFAVFEFYARGASLYYDDIAGYYARFNAPFACVPAGACPEPQVYMRKNFMVLPGAPWKVVNDQARHAGAVRAVALDVKTSAAGERSITFDYPFLYAVVDERMAAKVSPRFVYKVKAGVWPNGGSALIDYSLFGDRFMMLDENSPYNKFDNPVKEFLAVSADGSMAAVYDFSGNIRIVGVGDSKTAMIISGLGAFKSLSAAAGAEFFILCRDGLYITRIADKKLERIIGAADPSGEGYYGICCGGGKALLAAGPASVVVEAGTVRVVPAALDLNDSNRAIYFDGGTVVCCDYFTQTVNVHKLNYSAGSGYYIAASLAFRTGADALVRAALKSPADDPNGSLAVCVYDPPTAVMKTYLINAERPFLTGAYETIVGGGPGCSWQAADFAVFPRPVGPPEVAAVIGDRVEILRPGFLHDGVKTVFIGSETEPRRVPFLPVRLVRSGDEKVLLFADNRLTLIDVRGGVKAGVLEAAR